MTSLAIAILAAGSILAQSTFAQSSQEKRYERGPILVVEKTGAMVISATTILVRNDQDKSLALGLLQAAFPKEMGAAHDSDTSMDLASLDAPSVETVDEYIASLKKGHTDSKLPPLDTDKIRQGIETDLQGHFAVLQRYIGTEP